MTLIVLSKDGALHPFWSAADSWWPSAQRPWVISSQGLSVYSGKVCLQSVADGPAGIQVWDDGKMDPALPRADIGDANGPFRRADLRF